MIWCVHFSAMSGIPITSVNLVALDGFFLGINSWIRRWGSPCACCKQKQRELERFAVVYMCWVAMDSSLYQPATPLEDYPFPYFCMGLGALVSSDELIICTKKYHRTKAFKKLPKNLGVL